MVIKNKCKSIAQFGGELRCYFQNLKFSIKIQINRESARHFALYNNWTTFFKFLCLFSALEKRSLKNVESERAFEDGYVICH